MSGFPQPAPSVAAGATAAGAFGVTGTLSENGGLNSSAHAAVTNPAIVSATPFTPSATFDTVVVITTSATTAGTVAVTYGPTTGAENTWTAAVNLLAGMGEDITLFVPAGWKVVATTTGVTVGLAAAVHRI